MPEVFEFGEESRRLFGVFHAPKHTAKAGIVICPPFGEEMVATYARLAAWSKDLAEGGFAVLRFHPYGTGESDGKFSEFTADGAANDATTALNWLRQRIPQTRVGFLGLRFGGSVVVRAAATANPDFVVFWSPIVNLKSYFRELLRSRITAELIHKGRERVQITTADMTKQLEEGRPVDVNGFDLCPELYRQMTSCTEWPQTPPAPEVIWLGRKAEETSAGPVIEKWKGSGRRVDFGFYAEPAFWEDYSLSFPKQFASESVRWMSPAGRTQ